MRKGRQGLVWRVHNLDRNTVNESSNSSFSSVYRVEGDMGRFVKDKIKSGSWKPSEQVWYEVLIDGESYQEGFDWSKNIYPASELTKFSNWTEKDYKEVEPFEIARHRYTKKDLN